MTGAPSTAGELLRHFSRGTSSPRAHLEELLERIERADSVLHAFVAVYAAAARTDADAAELAFKRGYPLGPMSGVPFALKDIVDVAGRETAGGCKALAGRVPERSAAIAERLMRAGGILVGKTHTVELAMGGWGTNQHLGTPVNPWDLNVHRSPGASSSGSGVAVAAGLVPFAIGTDTGGSVRLPAAMNGIVGLKVTAGIIPLDGIIALSHTLDTPGPMARSVEDCALGFEILRGAEPHLVVGDLLGGRGVFGELDRGMSGLVVGAMSESERDGVDTEVLAAYDASLQQLAERGVVVRQVCFGRTFQDYRDRAAVIIRAEGYHHHGWLYEDPQAEVDEHVRARFLSGRDVSAADYLAALQGRIEDQAAFLDDFNGIDALATPTVAATARPLDAIDRSTTPARFTSVANYLGLCAASVPNGLTREGLPSALQIVARPRAEPLVLRIAAELERAAGGRFPSADIRAIV